MSAPDGGIDASRPMGAGMVLSSTVVARVDQYVHVSPPVPCDLGGDMVILVCSIQAL